jgi:hypothetical protein
MKFIVLFYTSGRGKQEPFREARTGAHRLFSHDRCNDSHERESNDIVVHLPHLVCFCKSVDISIENKYCKNIFDLVDRCFQC